MTGQHLAGKFRSSRGNLTREGFREGLTEQSALITTDGVRVTVELKMVHDDLFEVEASILGPSKAEMSTTYFPKLNEARRHFRNIINQYK